MSRLMQMAEMVAQAFDWHLAMLFAAVRADSSLEFELVLESEHLASQNREFDDAKISIENI